ncbi:hypothetical protein A3Q56_02543 [Intoshia linei]|uniref:tRNA (guanine-N(7)-)-methyltransferase n=1 Tax=Intoshia linei TaxID=1819745 RepID=A0A177B6E8_9BILA|nr:hypothetical protein A3Q56_02543 [Intoshia linei]
MELNEKVIRDKSNKLKKPKRKLFRQHAHDNPLLKNFNHYKPKLNESVELDLFFNKPLIDDKITVIDVGCGYGAFLVKLSQLFPKKLCLGLEIRSKVYQYTKLLVESHKSNDMCHNIGVCRTNVMLHISNMFQKNQLEHIFILYPDPHFKACKRRMRIISDCMVAEYAYLLKKGGLIYNVTDVEEYHEYAKTVFSRNKLFDRMDQEMKEYKEIFHIIKYATDESQKLNKRSTKPTRFGLIYRRI